MKVIQNHLKLRTLDALGEIEHFPYLPSEVYEKMDQVWIDGQLKAFVDSSDFSKAQWDSGKRVRRPLEQKMIDFEFGVLIRHAVSLDEKIAFARTVQEKYSPYILNAETMDLYDLIPNIGTWRGQYDFLGQKREMSEAILSSDCTDTSRKGISDSTVTTIEDAKIVRVCTKYYDISR